MKRIGFIDYYIDEWHANNYPKWMRESSRGKQFEVALAWQEISPEGKQTLEQWCHEQQVSPAQRVEQVIAECDCLVVLSPDNPERHWDLCEYALKSGKACYVDKTFAPDYATALRLVDLAKENQMIQIKAKGFRSQSLVSGHVSF